MESIAYINGELLPLSQARVSILDRGFLYGDGLFETMRTYNGEVFQTDAHLERLFKGAERLGLTGLSKTELKRAIQEVLGANLFRESVIRLSVSRGTGKAARLNFPSDIKPTVTIVVRELNLYPQNYYEEGIKVITGPDGRGGLKDLKSLNFLPNVLARHEAEEQGAFEAVFIDSDGYVTEGTVSNIFVVLAGRLLTPSLDSVILPGVTRDLVINLAREERISCAEGRIAREDIFRAEEMFLTNTTVEIMPVVLVDDKRVGDGKVGEMTKALHKQYGKRYH